MFFFLFCDRAETLEVQDQTKWLVFNMIHVFRIADPTNGQSLGRLGLPGESLVQRIFFVWAKIQLLAAPPRAVRQVRPGSADLAKVLPSPGDARLVDAPGVVFREFGPGEHL